MVTNPVSRSRSEQGVARHGEIATSSSGADRPPIGAGEALPRVSVDGEAPPAPRLRPYEPWFRVTKFDAGAAALADRHYSRRTIGSPQFMPPGETLILATAERDAVFGWWRPAPSSGIKQMNNLDGWTCTIFRNESPHQSSALILAAERALASEKPDCGPDGLLTYVWDSKVRSVNPGYCFKKAGWRVAGRSADGRKTLLTKTPPKGVSQ